MYDVKITMEMVLAVQNDDEQEFPLCFTLHASHVLCPCGCQRALHPCTDLPGLVHRGGVNTGG